jgi:hypothetical protein
MTDQHPLTPPPELVREWQREANHNEAMFPQVATLAAQWGADCELDACCEWMKLKGHEHEHAELRAARRPNPPSLKEEASAAFEQIVRCCGDFNYFEKEVDTIRRALEALPE